jgi:hypothetical protein
MAIIDGNQKLIETTIKDKKFLVTDGDAKYSATTVPVQKKIRIKKNSTSIANTQKKYNTSKIDNINSTSSHINSVAKKVYSTREDIESCCQKQPTIKTVMNLIPPEAQPYSNLVIEKYIIDTPYRKVTQYLIKDKDAKCSFNYLNQLVLNGQQVIPFTSDDCVTAVYSLNDELKFIDEDIPKVSLIKEDRYFTTTDITTFVNNEFNKNNEFAISRAHIDGHMIQIIFEKSETKGTTLQQNIQQKLDKKYDPFIVYWDLPTNKSVDISFQAADKVKELLGIDGTSPN